jgi:hypothetical protein
VHIARVSGRSIQYLAPDHALARALLGKGLNAAVVFPDDTQGTITFINPETRQRILDYNEDDCRATRVLLDGIRNLSA